MSTMDTYNRTPEILSTNVQPRLAEIKVIGVGGGGCNTVTRLYKEGIKNVEFLVCNTDKQALDDLCVPEKLHLGPTLTEGKGAGCNPIVGRNAALESLEDIDRLIGKNIKTVFITAGMGGGTGTGAAPVIAKVAKERGLLTIGIVTYPAIDDGFDTMQRAFEGIEELSKNVDSILIVDNQKIYEYYKDYDIDDAYSKVDEVLITGVKGITGIIMDKGYINVDLADVTMVMRDSGMSLLGVGKAKGERKAAEAVEKAFTSPLLSDFDLKTAKSVLVNIVANSRTRIKVSELDEIMKTIQEFTGSSRKFKKKGIVYDDNIEEDSVSVTVVATGFKMNLTPPSSLAGTSFSDEDIITLDSSGDSQADDIVLDIPGGMPDLKIRNFKPENLTVYLPGKSITDYESQTALERLENARNGSVSQ